MNEQPTKVRARDSDSYVAFTILAILLPLVGFILGIVYLAKSEPVDRKLGEHTLCLSILVGIIGWVLLAALITAGMAAGQ